MQKISYLTRAYLLFLPLFISNYAAAGRVEPIIQYQQVGGSADLYDSPAEFMAETNKRSADAYNACKAQYPHCLKFIITGATPSYVFSTKKINGQPYFYILSRDSVTYGEGQGEYRTYNAGDLGMYLRISCPAEYHLIPDWDKNIPGEPAYYCANLICHPPSVFESNQTPPCVERCRIGGDPKMCEPPPAKKTCTTQTTNPIDIIDGYKIRVEDVFDKNSGLDLAYYYNNQGGAAVTPYGLRSTSTFGTYIVRKDYKSFDKPYYGTKVSYPEHASKTGVINGLATYYWRHQYQELLVSREDGSKLWYRPIGNKIEFNSLGKSQTYTQFQLAPISQSKYGISGYEISSGNGVKYIFDLLGRLRVKELGNGRYQLISYDGAEISQVELWAANERLSYLTFTYQLIDNEYYLKEVTNNKGEVAQVSWAHKAELPFSSQYLLTQITYPDQDNSFDTEQQNNAARTFEYNDPDFPVSITQIYDVDSVDQLPSGKRLYAEFQYDTQGRAIYSSLANGVDAVQVDYLDDNTRAVTNALGKVATYRFNTTNGVKRLASITGEPTSTCAESNVSYEYDAQGYRILKTQNGIKTRYRYDTTGLEIERVEAEGTPEQRIIKTEWNTQLRKPSKVIYPGWVESFMYDTNGQLIKKARSEQ